MVIQETHAPSHSSIQNWFRNSGFYVASSSVSNKRCGTAILVRDVCSITQVKRDDKGRFLQVEVDIDGQKLRFVSLYAPNRNPARNTFFCFCPVFLVILEDTGDFFTFFLSTGLMGPGEILFARNHPLLCS